MRAIHARSSCWICCSKQDAKVWAESKLLRIEEKQRTKRRGGVIIHLIGSNQHRRGITFTSSQPNYEHPLCRGGTVGTASNHGTMIHQYCLLAKIPEISKSHCNIRKGINRFVRSWTHSSHGQQTPCFETTLDSARNRD